MLVDFIQAKLGNLILIRANIYSGIVQNEAHIMIHTIHTAYTSIYCSNSKRSLILIMKIIKIKQVSRNLSLRCGDHKHDGDYHSQRACSHFTRA